jgi:D-psicose/D-tagatose/L-ribulose 3-epimerase
MKKSARTIPAEKMPARENAGGSAARARRLAVSNIAWPREAHDRAVDLLCELGVEGLEIAPLNVFSDWSPDIFTQAARLRQRLGERGLSVPALQGWLFGVDDCALFGGDEARKAMVGHCRKVARLAGMLGAGACVYGAPRSRDPGDLTPTRAWDEAVSFLKEVGPIFAGECSALAFEANARRYGCRFATTTSEAVALVRDADAPGVGLQIDTGTIFLEDHDPRILTQAAPYAVHMHVSEPDLAPTGTSGVDHRPVAAALEQAGYEGWISIEMRAVPDWENALRNAVTLVRATYPGLVAA